MKRMINQQNEEPMDDPPQVEIGEKVKRVRRRVMNPTKVEISNSEQFLEYIVEKEPDSLPKCSTSQRYSTDHLLFNGSIPEGLYHIFGVAKDLLGSSYRPKECNLMVGKIKY